MVTAGVFPKKVVLDTTLYFHELTLFCGWKNHMNWWCGIVLNVVDDLFNSVHEIVLICLWDCLNNFNKFVACFCCMLDGSELWEHAM